MNFVLQVEGGRRRTERSRQRLIDGNVRKVASMEKQFLQFDETGHLKAGVHSCSWAMLKKLTFTNTHRKRLGGKLVEFLKWPRRLGSFPRLYIGGGFISSRPLPQDIDVVLETQHPFGPEAFLAMEPFFARGLDDILGIYSVHLHFWMEGAPATLLDYRSFFQYQRPQRPDCFASKKNGIVRLSLPNEDFGLDFESLDLPEAGRLSGASMGERERLQAIAA
jgi:hypothetical protein